MGDNLYLILKLIRCWRFFLLFLTYFTEIINFLFPGDSEVERHRLRLSERTCSFWSYINQPEILGKWLNPLYEPNAGVIWPSIAPISIQLWKELYLAHTSAAPWKGMLQCVKDVKQNHVGVRKIAGQLQSQIRRILDEIKSDSSVSVNSDNQDCHTQLAHLNLESQST